MVLNDYDALQIKFDVLRHLLRAFVTSLMRIFFLTSVRSTDYANAIDVLWPTIYLSCF